MSRSPRKNRLAEKPIRPHTSQKAFPEQHRDKNKIASFAIITILAVIPFSMGKYLEFNTPGPYDSGAYVYSAKHILDGARIGIEEKPTSHMGTLLVNMLGVWLCGFNETGPKLIQSILQATALVVMFVAMRKVFGTFPAAVGVIVASIYLSAPLIAKFGNVKEQYMIAFMIMGVSCFILRQSEGKCWLAILSGAFLAWAPIFKATGVSALCSVGLFVIIQPILGHRSWKQTGIDIGLLLTGAALSLGPVYLWLFIVKAPVGYWPYSFAWKLLGSIGGTAATVSYISDARSLSSFPRQLPRVLRYYSLLILPIALAVGAIAMRLYRILLSIMFALEEGQKKNYDHYVLLFACWWLFDMAFVWISPRSYEQYYLPLNASAAMLGGYLIAVYRDTYASSVLDKVRWLLICLAGIICMTAMSWHIFFGIEKSPHSGAAYGQKRRGYIQKLHEISRRRKTNSKGAWEATGEYIREHSVPDDRIYVWGWYPGIYVSAQRLSPAPSAFTSEMHVKSPEMLSEMIRELLDSFREEMPKYIVDSRKRHFPWNRPPLELWPQTQKGFVSTNKRTIEEYNLSHSKMLSERIGTDEALRYEAMKPFREFVMGNYTIIRKFGPHVLFELKKSSDNK